MPFHCHPGQILLKDMCHRLISHQLCNSVDPIIFVSSCTGSSLFHLRIWWLGIINMYGSFCFMWTVLIMLWCRKQAPFFWVTNTRVYSSKLISYLDWPNWCEHQVYCPIPRLTHTTPPFINQSVIVSSRTQAMKSNHLFLVFKVTFIALYLAFCVKFQSVALKGIFYSSLVYLQYYSMTEDYLK